MAGRTSVDLHVKVLNEAVVARANAADIDVLVYAPHFTHLDEVRERAARFSDEELLVVPGREYFTGTWSNRKHVLAVDPDYPVPDFLPLDVVMAELADQDAGVLVPHPEFLTMSMAWPDIETYRDRVDAVEVYNPKHLPWHNRRAREIARESELPTYLSSYAHLAPTVGDVWVEFEREIESAADLVAALQEPAPRRMFHRDGLLHALKCRAEFAHLGWENTWKKFDRVYLQGTEPTHPGHIAYDGAFDDVRLY